MNKIKQLPGVIIFLVWKGKFLLILRDENDQTIEPGTWSPVSGGVEDGDSYLQTLEKELLEEILVVPKEIIFLGTTRRFNGVFFGRLTDEERAQVQLGHEGTEIGFFSYNEILALDDLSQALSNHLENAPDVFRRISEEDYTPTRNDLFLQERKEFPPDE